MQRSNLRILILHTFMCKTKVLSTHNLFSQISGCVSVRILSQICIVCRKIATSWPTYTFQPTMSLYNSYRPIMSFG